MGTPRLRELLLLGGSGGGVVVLLGRAAIVLVIVVLGPPGAGVCLALAEGLAEGAEELVDARGHGRAVVALAKQQNGARDG